MLFFASGVASGAGLEFKSETIDFDKIPMEHNVYEGYFEYRNVSKKDIQITDVRPSCGCVNVVCYTDRLKPDETGELSVSLTPSLIYGAFEHTVSIYYDDSVEDLKIRGYIYEGNPEGTFPIRIGSAGFSRRDFSGGVIQDGLSETVSTIVYNYSDIPVLLDFSTDNDELLYSLSENPVPPHSTSSLYCSIFDESEQIGIHRHDVIVKENGKESGKLVFSVEKLPEFVKVKSRLGWILRSKLRLSDDVLILNREGNTLRKVHLMNKGLSTIRILQIDYKDDEIQIEDAPKKILPFFWKKIAIRLYSEVSPDCKYSKIKIYTDSPKSPVITINVIIRR